MTDWHHEVRQVERESLPADCGGRLRHSWLALLLKLFANQICRFPDSGLFDQFARHRAHQVFVCIERHQAFARELASASAARVSSCPSAQQVTLHCPGVGDELHPAPAAAGRFATSAGLASDAACAASSRFVEVELGKALDRGQFPPAIGADETSIPLNCRSYQSRVSPCTEERSTTTRKPPGAESTPAQSGRPSLRVGA